MSVDGGTNRQSQAAPPRNADPLLSSLEQAMGGPTATLISGPPTLRRQQSNAWLWWLVGISAGIAVALFATALIVMHSSTTKVAQAPLRKADPIKVDVVAPRIIPAVPAPVGRSQDPMRTPTAPLQGDRPLGGTPSSYGATGTSSSPPGIKSPTGADPTSEGTTSPPSGSMPVTSTPSLPNDPLGANSNSTGSPALPRFGSNRNLPAQLDGLPEAVNLPPVTDKTTTVLAECTAFDGSQDIELALVDTIQRQKRERPFTLSKTAGSEPAWTAMMKPIARSALVTGGAATPSDAATDQLAAAAVFRLHEGKLLFAWNANAVEQDAGFLRNCILLIHVGDQPFPVALRAPQITPPLLVDLTLRETVIKIDGADTFPDIDAFNLQLVHFEGLPPESHPLEGSVVKDNDEMHLLLREVDPAISLTMRTLKSGSITSVRIKPQYQDPVTNTPAEFTVERVEQLTKNIASTISAQQQELGQLQQAIAGLQAEYASINPGAAGSPAEANLLMQAQARVRSKLGIYSNRAKDLSLRIPRMIQLQGWLPSLNSVMEDTASDGRLYFRVYFTVGDYDVDVLRVGGDS